jgi:hypothetical protein
MAVAQGEVSHLLIRAGNTLSQSPEEQAELRAEK